MGWLDEHSGSVTAIATIVLAAITAIYVYLTRSLANSSRDAILEAQNAKIPVSDLLRCKLAFELLSQR
jgi:hypothetical protein